MAPQQMSPTSHKPLMPQREAERIRISSFAGDEPPVRPACMSSCSPGPTQGTPRAKSCFLHLFTPSLGQKAGQGNLSKCHVPNPGSPGSSTESCAFLHCLTCTGRRQPGSREHRRTQAGFFLTPLTVAKVKSLRTDGIISHLGTYRNSFTQRKVSTGSGCSCRHLPCSTNIKHFDQKHLFPPK